MNDLKRWATELHKCNEDIVNLCDALLMDEMEEGKYFGTPQLQNPDDWQRIKAFRGAAEKLIRISGIQGLLARIMEGERE